MAKIFDISDFSAPELDVYARLTENQLVNRADPANALFIAESPLVIGRALDAGCVPVSFLMERRHVDGKAREILARCPEDIPVYAAGLDVLTQLTGFHLTRGMLCAMRRPALPEVAVLCANAARVAVLENVMNPTNIGAIFRSAAALGVDAVLLTSAGSDPLYRRAVRVSMGTVFQVPWTYLPEGWPQTLRALNELDEAMLRGGEYDAGRQRRIASLRRNLTAARSDEERVRALLDLQQVFVTYELDSAARFVDSLYAFARSRESHNFERIAALAETDVLMGRGLTDQAETLFRQIDTAGMTTLEYRNWYARYNAIVWRRQAEATDPGEHRAWLDSLRRIRHIRIGVESLPAFTRIRERALELADNGRYDEAYAELEPLRHKELAPWNTAVLYYDMGQIAEQAGQEERAVEYYTRSAIADLQAGTRSYFSLYNLALRLFERNDLERASRYMQRTLDDALACKSGARIPLTSSAATAINRAVVNDLAVRNRLRLWTTAVTSLLLVTFAAAFANALRQRRRLQHSRRQLALTNAELREKNRQLTRMSDRVRDINAALVDSNRIKDRYVCQYVDLSVYYISRLDDLRRMICRQAKTESPEALIRRLSLPQNSLRQEFAEFYRRFDASFLEIFPRFIEQVDALLLPEARIEPRSPRSLTTELRILAAIRLGITDSGRIARFLNCAPTTVYTYRTKLRNMALDREGFEERIRRIGLFDAEEHLYKTDNEK